MLCLALPMIKMAIAPQRQLSKTEKRTLAVFPSIEIDRHILNTFPKAFESYVNDHFGFRDQLIHLNNYIKVKWLHTSPIDKVLLGKKGWLFLNEDGLLADYRGLSVPDETQRHAFRLHLQQKKDFLAQHGIPFIYVVGPDKKSIYPEFMPDSILRVSRQSRLDVLAEEIKTHTDVPFLDLRTALTKAKDGNRVYFKTDAHWNDLGAFAAYEQIIEKMKKWFPDIDPINPDVFDIRMKTTPGLDTANMLGLTNRFKEEIPVITLHKPTAKSYNGLARLGLPASIREQNYVEMHRPAPGLRAIVFRDSFCTGLIPFLSENFEQVVYIWSPYQQQIMATLLEKFHPDVVIEETVERMIGNYYNAETCHNILGTEALGNGDFRQAIGHFEEALKINPAHPDSYNNLGFAMLKARQYLKAAELFRVALKLDPGHPKARPNLETALYYSALRLARKADLSKAIASYKELLALAPGRPDIFYNIGCLYARQHQKMEALNWLKQAIANGYANSDALLNDEDLNSLRNTTEFKKMMEQFNENQ